METECVIPTLVNVSVNQIGKAKHVAPDDALWTATAMVIATKIRITNVNAMMATPG
jgi:hypothetical protein